MSEIILAGRQSRQEADRSHRLARSEVIQREARTLAYAFPVTLGTPMIIRVRQQDLLSPDIANVTDWQSPA